MKRTIATAKIGGRIRHRVKIESDPCIAGSQEARMVIHHLLQTLAEQPPLTLCGTMPFETLTVRHDERVWIVEAEALEPEPDA